MMSCPFPGVHLNGDSTMRGILLAVPIHEVHNFLPAGLELGQQNLTPPGTHPVMFFFNDIFRAQISVPSLIPSMTYHEHHVGVPFTQLTAGVLSPGYPGPYYFMPRLYLDNLPAIAGGIAFWGFAKQMAYFTVTANRYTVRNLAGEKLISLDWSTEGEGGLHPASHDQPFQVIRQILDQTLISQIPAAVGPFFALSDFQKDWEHALVEPLRIVIEVDIAYVPGQQCGLYPAGGPTPTALSSYEIRVPWRLSLPYPPALSS